MSTILTAGIILRRADWGDYDRQYVIYTRELGKIIAVAKGAKKIVSKLNSHLAPFALVELMLAKGNAFYRLAGVQTSDSHAALSRDFKKIMAADYFLETVDRLTGYDFPDERLFALLDSFLADLAKIKDGELLILNKALFNLLSHLGYGPKLTARTQKELFGDLNRLIERVAEKEMKSFQLASRVCVKNCQKSDFSL